MRLPLLFASLALISVAGFGSSVFSAEKAADAAPAVAAVKADPNAGLIVDPLTAEVWSTEHGAKYHTKDCKSAKVKTTYAAAIADSDTECATCKPGSYDATKITVFTGGEGGKKYHLFSCRYAKTATTLAKASADGLTPCATCKAPALWKPTEAAAPTAKDAAVPTKK